MHISSHLETQAFLLDMEENMLRFIIKIKMFNIVFFIILLDAVHFSRGEGLAPVTSHHFGADSLQRTL